MMSRIYKECSKLFAEQERASWNDIIYLYDVDSANEYQLCPMTQDHIRPNNVQKLKVRLATQVFSNTVHAAFKTLSKFGHVTKTMLYTSELVLFFGDLFDLFISSIKTAQQEQQAGFTGSDNQKEFLRLADSLLKSIGVISNDLGGKDVTNKFSFIKGWILNIQSLRSIWEHLTSSGFEFLPTRHLNQDCLDIFSVRLGALMEIIPDLVVKISKALFRKFGVFNTLKLLEGAIVV